MNRLGVGNKPLDLIGNPSRLGHKVIGIFAVHAASQKGLVISHKICNRLLEAAWYRGSSGLLKAEWADSGNRSVVPDPDGCLVQWSTDTETCEVPAIAGCRWLGKRDHTHQRKGSFTLLTSAS